MSGSRGTVRTVLGDLPAADLGVTNAHDHLMFRSPQLPGEELDDPAAAARELAAYRAAGGRSVVQWTAAGLGRRLAEVAVLSRACSMRVIAATGRHRAVHYPKDASTEDTDALTRRFVADLLNAAVPCGIIKVGTGFHHLDSFERQSLLAAAETHRETGAPIAIHLELGTAGDRVISVLQAAGVPPSAIILGHLGRNPDSGYQHELAASGVYLCFDGPSRANHHTDWRTIDSIEALAADGHLEQLLIGGDTTTAAARSVNAGPGMLGLLTGLGERIGAALGAPAQRSILVGNPARAFALH